MPDAPAPPWLLFLFTRCWFWQQRVSSGKGYGRLAEPVPVAAFPAAVPLRLLLPPGLLERAPLVFELVVGEFAYGCVMLPFCVVLPLLLMEVPFDMVPDVLPMVPGEPVLVVPVAPAPPAAAPPAEPPAAAKASVAGPASRVAAKAVYLKIFIMVSCPLRCPERNALPRIGSRGSRNRVGYRPTAPDRTSPRPDAPEPRPRVRPGRDI